LGPIGDSAETRGAHEEESMDEERFDRLTRQWAVNLRSRRTLVRLLAGSGLAAILGSTAPDDVTEVAASRRSRRRSRPRATEGDPRVIGLPCSQAVDKHVGPPYGGKCGKRLPVARHHPPHGCCPGSSCLTHKGTVFRLVKGNQKGRCYCDDGYEPDETTDGFCRVIPPPPPPCVELNAVCREGDHCCDPESASGKGARGIGPGIVTCHVVPPQKGTTICPTGDRSVPQCCLGEGRNCTNDCQCCGDQLCLNGICDPRVPVCHQLGDRCDDGDPCCPLSGSCVAGRCCVPGGASCSMFCGAEQNCGACCSGFCGSDGNCGSPHGCLEYGGFCSSSDECCNDVPCTAGRCRLP
jgi:hypothetical protein